MVPIDQKRVLVILTGGTAGMRRDPVNGSLVPVKNYLAEALELMLLGTGSSYKYPKTTVVEYQDQLDSSDMGPEEWRQIAEDIDKRHDEFDGFVVVMGTVSVFLKVI